MSNVLQDALMKGLSTDILMQLPTEFPILNGDVISLSNYNKTMWDGAISWTNMSLAANFILTQDAPYVVSNYGTVAIIEEPRPQIVNIMTEACKVSFNNVAYKKAERQGTLIDWYSAQLVAKVQAWDATMNSIILYGNPQTGTPGLLSGSGIPVLNSTVNLSSASPDLVINEIVRIATTPSNASSNIYKPTKIAMPQNLWNILNQRSYSANISSTLLQVIMERLNSSAGYSLPGQPKFTMVSVPQFNANQVMTVLPTDPEQIGAGVWDLEELDSPDNSEYWGGNLASAHVGGYVGVIAKRPAAGLIANLTY